MNVLSFSFRHSPTAVILALVAGIASGACNTGILALINSGLVRQSSTPTQVLVWRFVGLCLVLAVSRLVAEVVLARLGQRALYDLRMGLSGQILRAPLRQLETTGSFRILEALTNDLPTITNALLIIPVIGINIAVTAGGLIYLGWLSIKLLGIILLVLLVGILSYQIPVIRAQQYFRRAREDGESLLKHFQGLVDGIKELKLHSWKSADFLQLDLAPTAAALRANNLRGITTYSIAASVGQTFAFLVIGFLVFVLPQWQHVTAANIVAFTLVLLYLLNPLQVIMNTMPTIGRADVAIRKFEEIGFSLNQCAPEADFQASRSRDTDWQWLELRDIIYHYQSSEDSAFTLGPVSLKLRRGELLFISGGNGSGKTTLSKILTGLYIPDAGQISLDEVTIDDANRGWYRQQFSAVFSDFFLFERLLGISATETEADVKEYLTKWHLDGVVKLENGKWSTVDLSRGQRKRLALLAAYLEGRSILMFDEWAADQDPLFKQLFYSEFLPYLKSLGKTVIVITHDDRYFHHGDRLVRFESGKIVEDIETAGEGNLVSSIQTLQS